LLKNGKPDKDAAMKMDILRDEKIPLALHKANRKTYEVDWAAFTGHRWIRDTVCSTLLKTINRSSLFKK